MNGLIDTLLRADADQRMFLRADGWTTAGDIRAMAAHALTRMNDRPIFLHTASASRFLAGVLAAAARGKTIALPAHAQAHYLAEIGCDDAALITDDAFGQHGDARAFPVETHDPVLTFFTSGTTGAPKRVEKNLSRLEIEARALATLWEGDTGHVLATVSHQHIYGLLFRIVWPVLCGRTADDTPATYWENLEGRLEGATLVSSPAHLTRLPPRDDLFAPPPRLVFSSGQLLVPDAARACADAFGAPVTEVLGSTETGGIAWRRQTVPDAPWTPLPGVSISSKDDGALIVRSAYLQDDAPHETGDTADIASDGRFLLKPRGDQIAKIDGKRVSLTRVEQMLAALPEIDAVAALTLPGRQEAMAAIAVLTAAGRARLDDVGAFRLSRDLRAAVATALEPAERPKHWRFVDRIPTDTQGKRVLSGLRQLFDMSSPLDVLDLDVRSCSDAAAEIAFSLAPELIFFEGHFREYAILPGVAQAHLAVLIGQKLWRSWPANAEIARLKFRRMLTPGDVVVLRLKRDAQRGRLAFSYHLNDEEVSLGEVGAFTR